MPARVSGHIFSGLCVVYFATFAAAQNIQPLMEHLERRVAAAEKARDWKDLAQALGPLSGYYALTGRNEEALRAGERALELLKEVEDAQAEVFACQGLALAYFNIGNTRKSKEYEKRAQAISERMVTAAQLGGPSPVDIKSYEQSLESAINRKDMRGEALARYMLGNGYFLSNNLVKAVDNWQPAAALYHQLGEWNAEGLIYKAIARAMVSLKRPEDAIRSLRAAADIFGPHRAFEGQLEALDDIAGILLDQNLRTRAAAALEEALTIRARAGIGSPKDELMALVETMVALGQKDKARILVERLVSTCRAENDAECLRLAEEVRADLGKPATKKEQ